MSYEVVITNQARIDICSIYEYIADVLLEPGIAKKKYTRIEKALLSLDEMPEIFKRYDKEPWKSRNLRVMPLDKYLAFYTVDNERFVVTVMRVLYGARDIESVLSQDDGET
jgi:toxin ParE1/3/4